MNIIFCEECGSRNVIEDEALHNIGNSAFPCQICGFEISTEHLIDHTGTGRLINTSTYKVLIIDDDEAHLNLLQISLQNVYTVNVASTGLEGIKVATELSPDLILLDVSMPEMDGYEVCSELKSSKKTRHIPIIFVTAKTKGDEEYKGLSLGAVDYIFKPFNIKILNAKIASHLKFNVMQNELKQKIAEQEQYIEILKSDIIDEYANQQEKKDEKCTSGREENLYVEQEKKNLIHIINSIRELISIQDVNGKIIWANSATMRAHGLTFSDLQGKKCYHLYYNRDTPCPGCFYTDEVIQGPTEPADVYNSKLNQTFLQTNLPLFDTKKKVTGVACTAEPLDTLKIPKEIDDTNYAASSNGFLKSNYSELNDIMSTLLISSDAMLNMYKDDKKLLKINEYISDASKRLRFLFYESKKDSQ